MIKTSREEAGGDITKTEGVTGTFKFSQTSNVVIKTNTSFNRLKGRNTFETSEDGQRDILIGFLPVRRGCHVSDTFTW